MLNYFYVALVVMYWIFFFFLQQAGSSGLKPVWTNAGAEFAGKASLGVRTRKKTDLFNCKSCKCWLNVVWGRDKAFEWKDKFQPKGKF